MHTEDLTVPFEAAAGGTFPMTWGQRAIWKPIKWYGSESSYFNMRMTVDLPDGPVGVDAAVSALRGLVVGHEALRAHFADGSTGPQQRIAARGSFTVRIVHSTADRARADADELAVELARKSFDHDIEWPVRLGVVEADGAARHVVFVVSHIAADAWAFEILVEEFRAAVGVERRPTQTPTRSAAGVSRSREPSEQALFEQSEEGVRHHHAARDHWRRALEGFPPTMFDFEPAPAEGPRFKTLSMDSVALAVAAQRLAEAGRVSTSSVLLTGTALTLAALTGRTDCSLLLIVGNRHDDERRSMIAAAAQNGLFAHDYQGQRTVAEAVRATHRAGLAAHFYAHYDPLDLDRERDRIGAQRGVYFDLNAYFNDVRGAQDRWELPVSVRSEAQARALLAETRLTRHEEWEVQDSKLFMNVMPVPDRCRLFLLADTAYLPLATMERLLRGVETVLFEAAYRDVPLAEVAGLAGIEPVVRGAEWWLGPRGWTRPDRVAQVVRTAAATPDAAVVVEAGADGAQRLVAYVADPGGEIDRSTLRDRVVALLDGRTDAVAPDEFVFCDEVPSQHFQTSRMD